MLEFKRISLILLVLSIAFISCSRKPAHERPLVKENTVVVNTGELKPGIPRFFTWKHDHKNINFFLLKVDGNTSAYLDACVSCYSARLGYRFEDGYLVCNYCKMRYSVPEIGKGLGNCFPIKLEAKEEEGKLKLPLSELEKHASRF